MDKIQAVVAVLSHGQAQEVKERMITELTRSGEYITHSDYAIETTTKVITFKVMPVTTNPKELVGYTEVDASRVLEAVGKVYGEIARSNTAPFFDTTVDKPAEKSVNQPEETIDEATLQSTGMPISDYTGPNSQANGEQVQIPADVK
jgi:hypothetical protein